MSLVKEFNIDREEQKGRMKFLQLTETDISLLQELYPVIESQVHQIVDQFYDHLLGFPEARAFFAQPGSLDRAESAQKEYLLDLFRGVYGDEYFERRLQIGVVHERIGLQPRWYLGANSNFLNLMLPHVVQKFKFRPRKLGDAILAIVKVMNLDQQLVMDTYIGATVGKLKKIGNQIRHTIENLAPAAQRSADQSEAAADSASQGLTLAEEGTQAVSQTLDGMANQKEKVHETTRQISELSDRIGEIENMANLVSELTTQTDLLALNAAVEAARVGDQGGGFAVVAEEIRRLADQSKESVDQIHQLVREIQEASDRTVKMNEESTQSVAEGAVLLENSGEAFHHLASSIRDSHENVQEISTIVKEQAEAILGLQEMVEELT